MPGQGACAGASERRTALERGNGGCQLLLSLWIDDRVGAQVHILSRPHGANDPVCHDVHYVEILVGITMVNIVMGMHELKRLGTLNPAVAWDVHTIVNVFVQGIIEGQGKEPTNTDGPAKRPAEAEEEGEMQPDEQWRIPPRKGDLFGVNSRLDMVGGVSPEEPMVDGGRGLGMNRVGSGCASNTCAVPIQKSWNTERVQ